MDRSSGDVVDEGAKIKSPDLEVFVGDHLHNTDKSFCKLKQLLKTQGLNIELWGSSNRELEIGISKRINVHSKGKSHFHFLIHSVLLKSVW